MTREIKFRWYSTLEKKRVYWYYFVYDWKHIICNYEWIRHTVDKDSIWQYTWLKDKNWKEIYEWDILEKEWATIIIKCEEICIMFYAECIDEDHPNWCEDWIRDFYRIENFKVIWNKYENPDLLDKNKND